MTPAQLRTRAGELRSIARQLDTTPLLTLDAYAGPDTWQCPLAEAFLIALAGYQSQVLAAAEELRWNAWTLEQRAEQLEADEARAALLRIATAG